MFIRILAETTAAVLVTVAFTILFDSIWWAMLAAAVLMTGHLVRRRRREPAHGRPRSTPKGLLRGAAPVVRGVRIFLGPLAHGLVALGNRVTPGAARGSSFASEEQLLSMIDEAAENELIEEDDRELIHSVFDFTDTFVRAVMVPRTDMVTVDASASTREAMAIFLEKGVSRIPIVDDDADDVVGRALPEGPRAVRLPRRGRLAGCADQPHRAAGGVRARVDEGRDAAAADEARRRARLPRRRRVRRRRRDS